MISGNMNGFAIVGNTACLPRQAYTCIIEIKLCMLKQTSNCLGKLEETTEVDSNIYFFHGLCVALDLVLHNCGDDVCSVLLTSLWSS